MPEQARAEEAHTLAHRGEKTGNHGRQRHPAGTQLALLLAIYMAQRGAHTYASRDACKPRAPRVLRTHIQN
eukprot:scaffold139008_cov35-Tisochrysis_lutea.AAC.1